MACADLPRHLLRRVARSFAISLRFLPEPVRDSLTLAYLLARLSDTEVDGVASEAEAELLLWRDRLLEALQMSPDRALIESVWATIREGQSFDGARFKPGSGPLTAEELDRYTYLVAGCVGEFWTALCALRLPRFSRVAPAALRDSSIRFGKGLQLVNILRDRKADALRGRVYVEEGGVPAAIALASGHLAQARQYVCALRRGRLRAACALPLLLAQETLALIVADPGGVALKVSRSRMRVLLVKALVY